MEVDETEGVSELNRGLAYAGDAIHDFVIGALDVKKVSVQEMMRFIFENGVDATAVLAVLERKKVEEKGLGGDEGSEVEDEE